MRCPTCDHSMSSLGVLEGRRQWHCPRCGTHRIECGHAADGTPIVHDTVPKLVTRCRTFQVRLDAGAGCGPDEWHQLGIAESINVPGRRP